MLIENMLLSTFFIEINGENIAVNIFRENYVTVKKFRENF